MNDSQESDDNRWSGAATSEEEDGPLEYLTPALQQQLSPRSTSSKQDDDSSHYFLSEPSLSEDGDSSAGKVRAPQRVALPTSTIPQPSNSNNNNNPKPASIHNNNNNTERPPFRRIHSGGVSDEDVGESHVEGTTTPTHPLHQHQHHHHHPQLPPTSAMQAHFQQSASPVPNSPGGNTSLSSWDMSPSHAATKKQVLLQFPKAVRRRKAVHVERQAGGRPTAVTMRSRRHNNNNNKGENGDDHDDDDEYAAPRLPSDDTSSGSGPMVEGRVIASQRTGRNSNTARITTTQQPPGQDSQHSATDHKSRTAAADESVVMTFSDSDAEPDETTIKTLSEDRPLDWEAQHSADDENTQQSQQRPMRLPRLRMPRLLHRRQRSGDAAAANLVGGSDWKGMEQDCIPLPEEQGEGDDDDDEDDNDDDKNKKAVGVGPHRSQRPHRQHARQQHEQRMHNTSRRHQDSNPPYSLPRHQQEPTPPYAVPRPRDNNPLQGVNGPSPPNEMSNLGHAGMSTSPYGSLNPPDHLYSPYPPPQWAPYPPLDPSQHAWMVQMSQMHPSPDLPVPSNHSQQSNRSEGNDKSQYSEDSYESDSGDPVTVQQNRMNVDAAVSMSNLDGVERQFEDRSFRGQYQNVLRSSLGTNAEAEFANLGKTGSEKVPRSSFLPQSSFQDHHQTYICPRCGSRQREFFSVNDAPRKMNGPASYLAAYFAVYVIAALFIFGLEEGWKPLDCIYFAVVTLTTAGLGDLVPTTDVNKIICSVFIYFGVACIGLLLGQYIAGYAR